MIAEQVPCILFALAAVYTACHIPHAVHVVSHFVWHRLARLALRRPRTAITVYSAAMGGSLVFITSHPALYAYEAVEVYLSMLAKVA